MAESQLVCMEDGLMPLAVPETKPQFYYSETHRAALEELLRRGDGAFKTLLQEEKVKDFLSAREVKYITATFIRYEPEDEEEEKKQKPAAEAAEKRCGSGSLRSTYWPDLSDTDVPPLDIGWPSSGLFKGVTRINVFTHPPKENCPHIKEVVRKLIQESNKLVAIVMDLLTDLQILQDLFEASRRGVPIYIVLDLLGVPHFLDMCSRLQVSARDLQKVRTRTVKGVGLNLSFGRIPGNLLSKYMIIDGDKVMFGTYSFCWSSSRMDRNMITVMSGQVVDFYDNDFRELYATSDKLDLFKEFHLNKPQTGTMARAAVAKRPTPATSRFQVSLGDTTRADVKVPAHKYHNPKYLLALGQIPEPTTSLQDFFNTMQPTAPGEEEPENPSENLPPAASQTGNKESKKQKAPSLKKKGTWWRRKRDKQSEAVIEENCPADTPTPGNPSPRNTPTPAKRPDESAEPQGTLKKKKRGFWSFLKKSK